MATDETRSDLILRRLKDHPVIAVAVVLGIAIIAVAQIGESVRKLAAWLAPADQSEGEQTGPPVASGPPARPQVAAPVEPSVPVRLRQPVLRPTNEGQDGPLMDRLRTEAALRTLTIPESGLPISKSPAGTYFTVGSVYFDFDPEHDDLLEDAPIQIGPPGSSAYEVHHPLAEPPKVLAYVSQEAAARLAALEGTTLLEVLASPIRLEPFTVLAQLPIERLAQGRIRNVVLEDGRYLGATDFTIR